MAKGSIMLQIAVEQLLSPAVTAAPAIWAVALDSLDGDRTMVRGIGSEKSHAFYGWADSGHEFGELQFTPYCLTDLWLVFRICAGHRRFSTHPRTSPRHPSTALPWSSYASGTLVTASVLMPGLSWGDASDRMRMWTKCCRPDRMVKKFPAQH